MEPKATHCRKGEAGYNVLLKGTMKDIEVTNHINSTSTRCTTGRNALWIAKLCARLGVACLVDNSAKESEPKNSMREIFTYGSVVGALGNRRFYPEPDFFPPHLRMRDISRMETWQKE